MFGYHMPQRRTALLVLAMMLTSGCLGAIDDIEDEFEYTIDIATADYPKIDLPERTRSVPFLDSYDECDALLDDMKNALYEEMLTRLDQESYYHFVGWGGWWGGAFTEDGVEMAADGDAATNQGQGTGQARDDSREGEFSGTNNQESGVDEADFLKTDGYHIYMLNGNKLVIMGVPEFGEVEYTSELDLEGSPLQMMVDGDRIVIASQINAWSLNEDDPLRQLLVEEVQWGEGKDVYTWYRIQSLVKYTIVDISDRDAPEVEREMYIEGNYHTARLVDGTVRSVTHNYAQFDGLRYWVQLPSEYWELEDEDDRRSAWEYHLRETIDGNIDVIDALTLDDFAPHIYDRTEFGIVAHPSTSEDCSEFAASLDSVSRGFTTIMTFQMLGDAVELDVDHIASSWTHVYASQDVLLLAEPANDWWWFWRNDGFEDATNIHAFDISSTTETSYLGSGRVNGTVQDQFSMSEYEGSIRIASTSDQWARWWWTSEGATNVVTVLQYDGEDNLAEVGKIDGIAPGERIWSARFVGEKGYLVTFRNIDPLWVIDLSDPTDPTILGELEIPGVSTYIHPVNEDTLLTIGIGGDMEGLDWSTTQISLFDVSDPTNPTLAAAMPLTPAYTDENCEDIRSCGWSWSWSEATYEHKAFTYWAPENLLAVPLSTYRYVYDEDGRYGGYEYVSMLKLIDVDTENLTLSEHGEVDHSEFYNSEDSETNWWFSYSTSIRRSIFMGDYVYAFSALGVTIHDTDTVSPVDELSIPGHEMPSWYYEGEEDVEVDEGDEGDSGAEPEADSDGESEEVQSSDSES